MERIAVIRRGEEPEVEKHHVVIFDELITGLVTGEFLVVEQWGKVVVLSELIANYSFPQKDGKHNIRILHFLRGHNPALYAQVEFYEDQTFDITP